MINFDKKLFNIDIPSSLPTVGSVLVAEPFLREEHFHHGVIALIDYLPDQNAMGVVLNRTTSYTLQTVVDRVTLRDPVPLFCGGPMSVDRLFFIHTLGSIIPDARHIADDLYIGGDFDHVVDYVNSGYPIEGYIRFFIGYSGWSPRQLDEEIENRVWAVTHPHSSASLLEGAEDPYWHRFVRLLGNDFKGWRFHPRNPHSN